MTINKKVLISVIFTVLFLAVISVGVTVIIKNKKESENNSSDTSLYSSVEAVTDIISETLFTDSSDNSDVESTDTTEIATERHDVEHIDFEYFTFGEYEQNNKDDGKEPIRWIILEKSDDKMLLLSEYALDCIPYNDVEEDVTWETCSLRQWLNNDFVNDAFSSDLNYRISETHNVNNDNSVYNSKGGNDTNDRIFLLSVEEYEHYFSSGFSTETYATDYALSRGGFDSKNDEQTGIEIEGLTLWWLRTPGYDNKRAAAVCIHNSCVYEDGSREIGIKEDGYVVNDTFLLDESDKTGKTGKMGVCVRPAMWITIE